MGEWYSNPFSVKNGFRQGCSLSPLLFSLYINSLIGELKVAGVGKSCKGKRIPALLYADDIALLAEDGEMMRKGLKLLEEWCKE